MLRLLKRSAGPMVPILYLDANMNPARTAYLLKKLRKLRFDFAQGMAIVCEIQNCMPVQVDKVYQQVLRIKEKHKIPIYGFLLDECTTQSYYMMSLADEIYSLPSTLFQLQRNQNKLSITSFLQSCHIKKFTIKSNQKLSGTKLDKYTSTNILHIGNKKDSHLSQNIYAEAVSQRLKSCQKNKYKVNQLQSTIPKEVPPYMIGQEALKLGLIDKLGEHYDILRQKYPECHFQVIKYMQQPTSIKRSLAILTSPILLALFILKVMIKWGLIMYVWLKSQKEGKPKTIKQAQAQVQAQN